MTLPSCLIDSSKASYSKKKDSIRSVCINEEKNKVFEYDSPQVRQGVLFFTGDEFMLIKAKSREDARAWRQLGYGVLLNASFDLSHSDTQEFLNAFTQLEEDLYRRGLERQLSRQHAEERSDRKDCARQAVFIQQAKLRRQGKKGHEMLQKISDAYQDQCRHAKVFARRIAIADELVVRNGDDSRLAAGIAENSKGGKRGRRMERRSSTCSTASSTSMGSSFSEISFSSLKSPGQKQDYYPRSPATPVNECYATIA